MLKITALLAATLALFAVAAPAASASDATLRAAIRSADKQTKPASQRFAKAVATFAKTKKTAPARSATQKLVTAVDAAKAKIAKQQASTSKVRQGRTMYLSALTKLASGLKSFDKALASLQSGNKSKAQAQLKAVESKINSAEAQGTKAEKLIGIKSS